MARSIGKIGKYLNKVNAILPDRNVESNKRKSHDRLDAAKIIEIRLQKKRKLNDAPNASFTQHVVMDTNILASTQDKRLLNVKHIIKARYQLIQVLNNTISK